MWCEVAAQHDECGVGVQRVGERPDDGLRERERRAGVGRELGAERAARDGERVEVQQPALCEARKEGRDAACAVEVLHVAVAARLEIDEQRRLPADPVDVVERDPARLGGAEGGDAPGEGEEVHDGVGGAAECVQDGDGVLE